MNRFAGGAATLQPVDAGAAHAGGKAGFWKFNATV